MTRSLNLSGAAGLFTPASPRGGEARSLGAITTGIADQPGRRTFQPVRRNSYNVGEREGLFWRPVKAGFARQQLRAAEHFDRVSRAAGKKNGAFGHVGLEVLRAMHRLVRLKDGRLEPSIAYLMRYCNRSKDAVVRALRNLARHGFLEWMRRSEPIEGVEGPGPRVKQARNAYRLILPKQLLAAFRRPPLPADFLDRRRAEAAEAARMEAGLSDREWVHACVSDPGLRAALASLERSISASTLSGENPT